MCTCNTADSLCSNIHKVTCTLLSTACSTWLDLLPWRRRYVHQQLHEAPPCRTMLSHLCCLMNVDVTLFAVVLHHVNPSLLGFSLSSCPMQNIHGVQVSDIWYDPFFAHDQNTAFTIAVCDLLRPGVNQPYHTPLYFWSCLCELLLQSSSNRTFQIAVICFPVFVSKSKFQSCTSTHWVPLSHIPSTLWCYLCLRGVAYVCRWPHFL